MSDLILGKRYRWTVDGVGAHNGQALQLSDGTTVWNHVFVANGTLEALPDPLPSTPGSVVRYRGELLIRVESDTSYAWAKPKGNSDAYWGDSELAGATVLFDAGAER